MSDTPPTDDKGPVPYDRFAEMARRASTAKDEAAAATAALTAAQAAAATATQEAATARAAATAHQQALERFRSAVAAGLTDPEVVDAAVWAYERQPAEGRPEFGAALESWRAEPTKAPAVLRPWFAPPAAPAAAAPAPGATTAPPARDPAPPAGHTPAPLTYSPDVIDRIKREGTYAQHREAIMRELAGTTRRG